MADQLEFDFTARIKDVKIDTKAVKESAKKAINDFSKTFNADFGNIFENRNARASYYSVHKILDPFFKQLKSTTYKNEAMKLVEQSPFANEIKHAYNQYLTKQKVLQNLKTYGAGTASQARRRMKSLGALDALSAGLTGTFSEEQFRKGKIREAIIASNLRAINPATGKILSGITGDLSHLGPTDNQELKDMSSFYKNQAIRSAVIQSNLSAINPATGKVLSGLTGDLSYLGPTNNKELKDMNAFYKNEAIRSAIIQSNLKAVNPATGKVLSGITGDLSYLGPNESIKKLNDFYFNQEYRDLIAGQYKQIKPTSKLTQALKSQADLENRIKTGKIPVSLGEIFAHKYDKDFLKKEEKKKEKLLDEGYKREKKEKKQHNKEIFDESIKTLKHIRKYALGALGLGVYGFHKLSQWVNNSSQNINQYENYQTMYGSGNFRKLQQYEKLFYKYGNVDKQTTRNMFGHFADMYTRARMMPTNSTQMQKLFGMLRITELPADEFDLFNKIMRRAFSGQLTREEASLLTRDFGIPAGVMNTLEKMKRVSGNEWKSIFNTNMQSKEGTSLVLLGESLRGLTTTWESLKDITIALSGKDIKNFIDNVDSSLKEIINIIRGKGSFKNYMSNGGFSKALFDNLKLIYYGSLGGALSLPFWLVNPALGAGVLGASAFSSMKNSTPDNPLGMKNGWKDLFTEGWFRSNEEDEKILRNNSGREPTVNFNVSVDKVSARDISEARDIGSEFGKAVFNSAMNEMKKGVLYQRGSMNFSV